MPVISPRRNRVTPTGDVEALALRGAWTGNRGILHSDSGEIVRLHAHSHWLTCALQYKGVRREQWLPHQLTWLFFQDEAVSLAAGHRPCALCRRESYHAYRAAWAKGLGEPPMPRPARGSAPTLTPPASLAALRAGYPVQIDDGARGSSRLT